jgi:hypothetical protein
LLASGILGSNSKKEKVVADTKKILLGVGIGCGVLLLLGAATCAGAYYWGKGKITQAKEEMDREAAKNPAAAVLSQAIKEGTEKGEKSGEGSLVGAMKGLAGAGMAMGVSAISMQVIPSLPASEQDSAKQVFKAFNEKSGRMGEAQFDAVGKMMDRFSKATDGERKAKSEALEKAATPQEKLRLSQEMLKVNPEAAKTFVNDLKDLTDSIK